jgi:hypothetical protein
MKSARLPITINDHETSSEVKMFGQVVSHDTGSKSWILTNDPESKSSATPHSLRGDLCEALIQNEREVEPQFGRDSFRAYVQHPSLGDDGSPRFLEVSNKTIAGKDHWMDGRTLDKSDLEQRLGVEIPVAQSHEQRAGQEQGVDIEAAALPSMDRDELRREVSDDQSHDL